MLWYVFSFLVPFHRSDSLRLLRKAPVLEPKHIGNLYQTMAVAAGVRVRRARGGKEVDERIVVTVMQDLNRYFL